MNTDAVRPDSELDFANLDFDPNFADLGSATSLLIRVSGPDTPGITAELMSVLGLVDAQVQDLEQVLLRGHLTLAAVVDVPLHPDALF